MAIRKRAKAAAASTTTTTTTTTTTRTTRAAAARARLSLSPSPPSPPSLDRVDGPSRVSKRISKRAAAKAAASAAATVATRYSERLRALVVAKISRAPVPEVGDDVRKAGMERRTGRVGKTPATPSKSPERKAQGGRVEKTKPKPRKRRGFTSIDVPDRLAGALRAHLQLLLEGEVRVSPAAGSDDVEMSDGGEDDDEDVVMSDVERHCGDGDLEMLDREQAQDVPLAVDMDVDLPPARTEVIVPLVQAPPARRVPVQPQGNRSVSSQAPRVAAPISLVIKYEG